MTVALSNVHAFLNLPLRCRYENNLSKFIAAGFAVAGLGAMGAADARDQVRVVGSSTVFPYSQAVAESFANKTGSSPVVESTRLLVVA